MLGQKTLMIKSGFQLTLSSIIRNSRKNIVSYHKKHKTFFEIIKISQHLGILRSTLNVNWKLTAIKIWTVRFFLQEMWSKLSLKIDTSIRQAVAIQEKVNCKFGAKN